MPTSPVAVLDRFLDGVFERWRGRPAADLAAAAASGLGDHGLVWFLVGVARGRRPGRRRALAVRAVLFTGLVTPVLNTGLKAVVGRVRPDRSTARSLARVPRTSSFPSGHTLAAWCAATLLAEDDPLAPVYYATAAAVAASRVHLRFHHASDVVAGAALGVALGHLGRRLFPAEGTAIRKLSSLRLPGEPPPAEATATRAPGAGRSEVTRWAGMSETSALLHLQ